MGLSVGCLQQPTASAIATLQPLGAVMQHRGPGPRSTHACVKLVTHSKVVCASWLKWKLSCDFIVKWNAILALYANVRMFIELFPTPCDCRCEWLKMFDLRCFPELKFNKSPSEEKYGIVKQKWTNRPKQGFPVEVRDFILRETGMWRMERIEGG